ncbi:unnamed protein product [Rhizoctonia solani]|uniref:C2H2-type domain-containing protein n=1 Tax=Rhizoctonia solani TaxID=456999 RepID=A0A8H3HQD0_9AGAM|nr:unnamed protein product [Rhizoctonia solani]CAE6533108.1 unnamed protein product [Rhizoctonia solani]
MQLAYYQSSQAEDSPSWLFGQHKASYDDSYTRMPVRSDSLLYPSEFADPNSNLELPGQELALPYPAHSSSSGYPMASLEGPAPNGLYHHRETVATASSHINPEPMYSSPSPVFTERQQQLDLVSEPFSHSWSTSSAFQVSTNFADAHTVRYSPYTVKSQRPINGQDIGTDTPTSPLSLSRSKHSSSSPSPGPLTPAIAHISLQTELCTVGLEPRPTSSGSSRNLYDRNDEVDPDRPYPCSSCRMAFARQHDLTRHSRVHSGETPYYCHGCRQGFRRSDARSRHWGKDAQCLSLHQRRVEGTEEGRKLQKSLLRLNDKVGRVGTASFRVHKPPTRSMRGSGVQQ